MDETTSEAELAGGGLLAAERPRLLAAAYRMLGTRADAEDAVQEAFTRWLRLSDEERGAVRAPGAWLLRVTGRVCLDVWGSARRRRELYVGEWLPEPLPVHADAADDDPAERVERADSVSTALLLVLETLTPAERVAFVLHDVFAVSFTEIADVVGRTPAACRQLAASARRHVGSRPGVGVSRDRHSALVRAFADAAGSGRLEALVAVLDPDVVLRSDGGGRVSAARRPVRGSDDVARFLLGLARKQPEATYEPVVHGDGDGILIRLDAAVAAVVSFATDGARVTDIWMMRNPDKLGAWR
ncbi:MAG: RNA polymerase sigma factor SigJ [Candidatus Microbacterium phytovorans]|uniref:RNA polymerase sigma factor SigJ n=1 Tax=Candidatus Microbacterium phytovorans TaxID=3121374 RepID=A0AAJ5VYA8_9MICO|nr:RNA polymerase sigma factor SigJ [Microbacterium sp.]WEK12387.1 MAG: RNA polymerase sigma factor SigJ [Microbacterium sp.]